MLLKKKNVQRSMNSAINQWLTTYTSALGKTEGIFTLPHATWKSGTTSPATAKYVGREGKTVVTNYANGPYRRYANGKPTLFMVS